MKAIWQGTVIAESDDTRVVEGNHYFPIASIRREYFEESDTRSYCPWKGYAGYFHVNVGDRRNQDAAWWYSQPKPGAEQVKERVAFRRGVEIVD